ncbi:DUF6597 domain-containing transcriptional factor [Flavobacterium beibuense]|uniref:DUF6597 domain-containing transcriptional factor n=1 Tax=Flavobacterium beibuense TaxID=657326 RepID=UPI003A954D55
MNNNTFYCKFIEPEESMTEFVESIGVFHNPANEPRDVVVLPDGRIDLFFSRSATEPFHVTLIGLETEPEQRSVPPQTLNFAISFKPLAVEYILQTSIAEFLNSAQNYPNDFWGFNDNDLNDFDAFYKKISDKVKTLIPKEIDERKRKLFNLIYESKGEMTVQELSQSVSWSSRQINRYFNQYLGLSLKSYCNILRFRKSLEHVAKGKLFPELNFTDQNHFIKEIKKFSGVVPKELSKNKDDRFVLLSLLKRK